MTKKRVLILLATFLSAGIVAVSIRGGKKSHDTHTPLSSSSQGTGEPEKDVYRCSMHPEVHSEHPGDCPICHMKLTKVEHPTKAAARPSDSSAERKIKYYRNPMDPSIHSDKPAKDSMGMDYIPVYEGDASASTTSLADLSRGSFTLSPEQMKLTGSKVVVAERRDLTLEIRVPGRVIGGTRVSFQAFEQDLPWIKPGMGFSAETPAAPGERLIGKVTSIESFLDPMTRTVRVNGNITRSLRTELRTESSLVGKLEMSIQRAVTVPEDSVLHVGARNLIYVFDGENGFSPREVLLGGRAQGFYEVKEGLSEGERISGGPNFLFDSESRIRYTYD